MREAIREIPGVFLKQRRKLASSKEKTSKRSLGDPRMLAFITFVTRYFYFPSLLSLSLSLSLSLTEDVFVVTSLRRNEAEVHLWSAQRDAKENIYRCTKVVGAKYNIRMSETRTRWAEGRGSGVEGGARCKGACKFR